VSTVFADTFYWIALTTPLDAAHERAKEFTEDVVTTQEVLTEYLNFFSSGPEHLRRNATKAMQAILRDPTVRIVPQSDGSFHAGLDLFRARPDNGYSLTDCISMQTMRREGLIEVLTNDRHFEQEGFRPLFRES
jgi:predicted nucleic acid-binding protein